MQQFLGEIQIYGGTWAPTGWAFCDGQLLDVKKYSALFSLLGTIYGGDGRNTFALPDLRGRVAIGEGQGIGPDMTNHALGTAGGQNTVDLSAMHTPIHSHTLIGRAQAASTPNAGVLADASIYSATTTGALVALDSESLVPVPATAAEPHENRQPFQAVNFIIALDGIYPQRS